MPTPGAEPGDAAPEGAALATEEAIEEGLAFGAAGATSHAHGLRHFVHGVAEANARSLT